MNGVAVTGAGGYLGGRLIAALVAERRNQVVALARRPVPWLTGVDVVATDLTRPSAALARALADVGTVIHLAGANEIDFRADPRLAASVTRDVALVVAGAAREAGVGRLIYVSTIHVYGDALAPGALVSETAEARPTSPYASSRLEVERLVAAHAGLHVVVLRLSNGVGAPVHPAVDRWSLVANDLCRQAVTAGALHLQTSGRQGRDFVALRDVVDLLCGQARDGALAPGTYNLASGRSTAVLDLARLVQRTAADLGLGSVSLHAPGATGPDPGTYRIDVTRLAGLGWRSTTALSAAVEDVLRFCIAAFTRLP